MPPKDILHKTQWACQEVKLIRFMSIFHLQKSLEIFDKNSADKFWSFQDNIIFCPKSEYSNLMIITKIFKHYCKFYDIEL